MAEMWYGLSKRRSTSSHVTLYYDHGLSNILSKRDSSASIADEEILEVEDAISSKLVIQEHSSFQFEGVRFTPKVVEFNDAFDGKQFVQKIELQNIGKRPVMVKIGEPSSFVFHMNKHDRSAKMLCCGRSITRTLSYVYHNNDLVLRSQIRVQINGRSIDYPIIVKKAQPVIEVRPPELDFKVINMGASAKTLKLTLVNSGGKGTKFAIDLGRNEMELVVNPPRGTIRAKSEVIVHVEMVGLTEGEFYKEMWITTNERPIRVPVIAEVMRPRLEVYHPNATGDFTLINFPPTFRGTQRLDTIVLRNFSADMTPFAIFAEIGGELKGCGEARKLETAFQMFTMSAEEGRLEPFESRIVTISFKPLRLSITEGWHHRKAEDNKKHVSNEFLVFFRISRVHCIERHELEKSADEVKAESLVISQKELDKRQSIMFSIASAMAIPGFSSIAFDSGTRLFESDDNSFSNPALPAPTEDKDVVRLCLHGAVWEPDLLVQPNTLFFEKSRIRVTETKVLKLTNQSPIALKFEFHKVVNMIIKPVKGWLKPKEATDVEIQYTPTFQGTLKSAFKIEIFGKSAVLYDGDKELVSLKMVKVAFTADVSGTLPSLKPATCFGASPPLVSGTRRGTEVVAYRSHKLGTYWKTTKLRLMVQGGDTLNLAGEIYPQNLEEMIKKLENHRIWNEYLKQMADLRLTKPCSDTLPDEPSICDFIRMELSDRQKLAKIDKVKNEDNLYQVKALFGKGNILPKLVLVPLSPIFLSNIKVEPKLIDFAMVAPNASVSETLKLHNMNSFPISVRFIPGKSGVTLPDGDIRLVPPLGKKLLRIVFRTKDFGRYNGFLDYVINGSHLFKITVSANVVPRTLIIPDSDLSIDLGNYPTFAAFQPNSTSIQLINNLRSPIKFHWEMQTDSAFFVEPLNGEVPPMTTLMNYVYFNLHPDKSVCAEANLISESGSAQPVKLMYRKLKSTVYFSANRIELNEIALNLSKTVYPRLVNVNYYDVAFEVMDCAPIPGIKISPRQGIIKARCFYDLEVDIQIPVIIDFQFDLKVRIQNGASLCLKIYGSVVFPSVKITPQEVTMRKISVQSFDVASICVENTGTTPARIEINLKEYPEYRISRNKNKLKSTSQEEEIYLLPRKSCQFFIHFEPKDVARYQFYLPTVINGILGPPMLQDGHTENASYYLDKHETFYERYGKLTRSSDLKLKIPCACVNCTVTGHLLKFSTLNAFFWKQTNRALEFQTEEIEIKNIDTSPAEISIRTDDVNNPSTPFKLEVLKEQVEYHPKAIKIDLQGGETVTLKAKFVPYKAGEYSIEIPVFLKGYNNGYAYNLLTLTGEAKKATISVETREIHFPPVSPRIGTEVIIQVFAIRYTTPEILNCNVLEMEDCGKSASDQVKILWLDDPKITGTQDLQSFSVKITFQSPTVVSLRTFILFTDGRGEYFPVLLTAVADNCSITNHLFLSARSSKYKLIRDESYSKLADEEPYFSPKIQRKQTLTNNLYRRDTKKHKTKSPNKANDMGQPGLSTKIEPGPKLVIQATKSMQRLAQLNFVCVEKEHDYQKILHMVTPKSISVFSRIDVLSDSTKSVKTGKGIYETITEVTFPNFPNSEDASYYEKYLKETLKYVELWVYEVVFHCEEYMIIPTSFQMAGSHLEDDGEQNKEQKWELPRKTIVDLLIALAGPSVRQYFPNKPIPTKDPSARADFLYGMFHCLLNFLDVQGSFLPHVKPEILLCYRDYLLFLAKRPLCESLKCVLQNVKYGPRGTIRTLSQSHVICGRNSGDEYMDPGQSSLAFSDTCSKPGYNENYEDEVLEYRERKYVDQEEAGMEGASSAKKKRLASLDFGVVKDYRFKYKQLDEKTFSLRSTQAWLDVLLQIYRTLVLPKIVYRKFLFSPVILDYEDLYNNDIVNSISSTPSESYRRSESIVGLEVAESNVYTVQERILLAWLKHHYDLQRPVLWPNRSASEIGRLSAQPRNIDSFRTDLTDSLVLMAVTASYCPYLIPNYFVDVFHTPENQEQIYHNAIKLTSAWREVNIALTVEPRDIVNSNSIFMLMIVVHLYDILPLLCPRSLIRFTAPLTEGMTKSIELFSKIYEKVIYEAKFIGLQEGSFRLVNSPSICLKPRKKYEFKIAYIAKRVHKVSVTLLLDGAYVSPNFAKSMVFHLEGEPSELTEFSKINIHGYLYKVACMEIPITSPYPEETNYEISYSTVSPRNYDQKLTSMKPWRDIWNRKTSRRLFINQNQLDYPGNSPALLNITVACLTVDTRKFWLLFHSPIGDFIVRIDIYTKFNDCFCGPITVLFPNMEAQGLECTCSDIKKALTESSATTCPFLRFLTVPARNNYLWDTMFVMFQKTLDAKEKMFWKQHFETNIGIRLIKWLLSQDESPEVIDEFIPSLRTNVTYLLKIDSNAEQYITIPSTVEIPDIRLREPIHLPIHISDGLPDYLKVTLTMTSESKKEIRTIKYTFQRSDDKDGDSASIIIS